MPEDHRSRLALPDDAAEVHEVTIPPRRALADADRLAALRRHLALGQSARLHFFPGGASFEHEGAIIRVRDEEIMRTMAERPTSWEDEEESDPPASRLAVVDLAVVERTRAYRADPDAEDGPAADADEGRIERDGGDDPAGDTPIIR